MFGQIAAHILLENTRPLARGIERLCKAYKRQEKAWEMQPIGEFIRTSYLESVSADSPPAYLAQNPNARMFQFRHIPPMAGAGSARLQDEFVRLAAMVLMCHELEELGAQKAENLANSYETLCNCMREIMAFDMCYIAYQYLGETRILAASCVYHEHLQHMLSEQTMAGVLDDLQRAKAGTNASRNTRFECLGDIAFLLRRPPHCARSPSDFGQPPGTFLFLPLEFFGQTTPQGGKLYLVFNALEDRGSLSLYSLLNSIRDTLFLRGRLVEMLDRDFFRLLNIGREYSEIDAKSRISKEIHIFHLSDLHVTEENYQTIISCLEEPGFFGRCQVPIDFIVITGDVVQGRCSAKDLESNYRRAAQVIRVLAFQLWKQPAAAKKGGKNYALSQEWKKRILIIPGNHDYASMNELETQHDETHRASAGGRPASKDGSPMVKFTYYIDFLRQLLDIDVGALTDNGLNELRSYDRMGVSFLSLNTSIMANPLRNNKVHLDERFVDSVKFKLIQEKAKGNAVVCLCHHGPQYTIDYLSDQYYQAFVCAALTKKFHDYIFPELQIDPASIPAGRSPGAVVTKEDMNQAFINEKIDESKPLADAFVQAYLRSNGSEQFPGVEAVQNGIKRARKRSRLYHAFQLLAFRDADAPRADIDERYQRLISSVRRAELLSYNDDKEYKRIFHPLEDYITVTLSGHTHISDLDREKSRYTVGRFFEEKIQPLSEIASVKIGDRLKTVSSLTYGVCTISFDGAHAGGIKVQYRLYS